jgi:hypothetical protein
VEDSQCDGEDSAGRQIKRLRIISREAKNYKNTLHLKNANYVNNSESYFPQDLSLEDGFSDENFGFLGASDLRKDNNTQGLSEILKERPGVDKSESFNFEKSGYENVMYANPTSRVRPAPVGAKPSHDSPSRERDEMINREIDSIINRERESILGRERDSVVSQYPGSVLSRDRTSVCSNQKKVFPKKQDPKNSPNQADEYHKGPDLSPFNENCWVNASDLDQPEIKDAATAAYVNVNKNLDRQLMATKKNAFDVKKENSLDGQENIENIEYITPSQRKSPLANYESKGSPTEGNGEGEGFTFEDFDYFTIDRSIKIPNSSSMKVSFKDNGPKPNV